MTLVIRIVMLAVMMGLLVDSFMKGHRIALLEGQLSAADDTIAVLERRHRHTLSDIQYAFEWLGRIDTWRDKMAADHTMLRGTVEQNAAIEAEHWRRANGWAR